MNSKYDDLPGVTYVETEKELRDLALKSLAEDTGDHLTTTQIQSLLSRSRLRAPA